MRTSRALIAAIQQYDSAVVHTAELIRVKLTVPVENQAAHIQDGFPALWIARLQGQYVMLESMLHHGKCYAGYYFVNPNVADDSSEPMQIGIDNPAFAEWARHYVIRR
jgi:hypothetical protein